MANVRERAPGRWELRVYTGRDPLTGTKRYTTKTAAAASRKEATRLAYEFERELTGAQLGSRALTVGDLLERWYNANARDWSPATAYNTRSAIDSTLAGLRDVRLVDLRAVDLDAFYDALRARGGRSGRPLTASTVTRLHGMLRLALDQAVRWDLIAANPADRARPGRMKRTRICPPHPDEVLALLQAAGDRDPEILAFLFLDAETGARRGELAALRLDDFNLQADAGAVTIARDLVIGLATPENERDYAGHYWPGEVRRGARPTALIEKDPKTEESIRTVALSAPTVALVIGQARRVTERFAIAGRPYPADGFLFPAHGDGTRPLRPDTWTHRFTSLRDGLGLAVRLHDLRHFVATSLLTSGHDLATVAGRLGHGGGGKTTLAIYAHFLKEPDRAASDHMGAILRPTSPPPDATIVALTGRTR